MAHYNNNNKSWQYGAGGNQNYAGLSNNRTGGPNSTGGGGFKRYGNTTTISRPPTQARPQAQAELDLEAAIAQQQSIYVPRNHANPVTAAQFVGRPGSASPGMPGSAAAAAAAAAGAGAGADVPAEANLLYQVGSDGKRATVIREGGGKKWEDPSLLEWDPAHFRLFIGNLAGDVGDDTIYKAFARFASVSKARVIRDKKSSKSKGYGFIAFKDPEDYFKAFKEMNGKYIGSHPVQLRKATTEIKSKTIKGTKHFEKATSSVLKTAIGVKNKQKFK
ncbi:hypothetical protein V1514DRAFT_324966 [Lipomyces japonicus]|uniref:uncharacterized protein n=1 Tax=Lipomyces japonicus TaxID=56871 RepID=UPI0034CEA773